MESKSAPVIKKFATPETLMGFFPFSLNLYEALSLMFALTALDYDI